MANNALQLVDQFEEFVGTSLRELRHQYKTILGAGAAELKKETKKELLASVPAANQRNPKYSDRLIDAVRSYVMKDETNPEVYVHIMGTRKAKSGTFRTRFFEGGTKIRKIKSGKYAGREVSNIEGKSFFERAISKTGSKVVSAADARLAEVIRKMNED